MLRVKNPASGEDICACQHQLLHSDNSQFTLQVMIKTGEHPHHSVSLFSDFYLVNSATRCSQNNCSKAQL